MFHRNVFFKIAKQRNHETMRSGTPCRRPLVLKSKQILLIVLKLKYIGILAQCSNHVFDNKNYVTVLYHDGKPI